MAAMDFLIVSIMAVAIGAGVYYTNIACPTFGFDCSVQRVTKDVATGATQVAKDVSARVKSGKVGYANMSIA